MQKDPFCDLRQKTFTTVLVNYSIKTVFTKCKT